MYRPYFLLSYVSGYICKPFTSNLIDEKIISDIFERHKYKLAGCKGSFNISYIYGEKSYLKVCQCNIDGQVHIEDYYFPSDKQKTFIYVYLMCRGE